MQRLFHFLERISNGRTVLITLAMSMTVYLYMLLVTIPMTMEFAGGMKILDMMPLGYDSEYVHTLFEALGDEGRAIYLHRQLPADLVYPLLFAVSFCLLMTYILKKLDRFASPYYYLCILPLVGGLFDYFENFGTISMLNAYPDLPETLITLTNIFTVVKSMVTALFFVVLIALILLWLGSRIRVRYK